MNQVPTKIVLKSTTRMSLNDRFSNIVPNVQSIRANMVAEHQVSSANRRLAQQMANRPGIQQNQVNNMMYNNTNNNMMMRQQGRGRRGGPLQQRVGRGNVKARLSLPNTNQSRGQQPRGRGGRGGFNQGRQQNNAYGSWNNNNSVTTTNTFKPRGRGAIATRSPRGRGAFRGTRGQQFNRFTGQATRGGAGGWGRGALNYQRARGRGRGRGATRGGRGGANKTGKSVEELDSQLDQYMAKTKTALDSELDAYMTHI